MRVDGDIHRIGLYDGIPIKESHVAAIGSIAHAIAQECTLEAGVPSTTEVENLNEAPAGLAADFDLLLADDFPSELMREAVCLIRAHRAAGVQPDRVLRRRDAGTGSG